MNIYYNPLDMRCKSIIGGIEQNQNLEIRVYGMSNEPCLFVLSRDGQSGAQYLHMDKVADGWKLLLNLPDPGLYFYYFQFGNEKTAGCGKFRNLEFSESVIAYQILVYEKGFNTPEWFKGGIMYQIFPDRFYRSGAVTVSPEKWLHAHWNEAPEYRMNAEGKVLNNDFFGGNIRGIIEKLDYLQGLHVTILYLNPIFRSFSNHRYDTGDFMEIDPTFGTEEEFAQLVEECRKRGIRIILDGVFNHTGDDSLYFNKYGRYPSVGAYQSKDSEYYAWYSFIQYPDKYHAWWGIDNLPAVNEECPSYAEYITGENGVLKRWLKYPLGGYRLDVADELPDEFIEKIRTAVKDMDTEAIVLGEVWEDASNKIAYSKRRKYFWGKELDSVMNYPLKDAIIQFIMSNNTTMFRQTVAMLRDNYPKSVLDSLMNILGTHDTARILTAMGGIHAFTKEEMSRTWMDAETHAVAKERVKAATVLLFTVFGVPCIYYGDEIGMEGYSDPFCRFPFDWDHMDIDMLEHFRRLAEIRSSLSVFCDSDYTELFADESCLVFERRKGKEVAVVIMNRGYKKYELSYRGKLFDLLHGRLPFTDHYTITPQMYTILSNKPI